MGDFVEVPLTYGAHVLSVMVAHQAGLYEFGGKIFSSEWLGDFTGGADSGRALIVTPTLQFFGGHRRLVVGLTENELNDSKHGDYFD